MRRGIDLYLQKKCGEKMVLYIENLFTLFHRFCDFSKYSLVEISASIKYTTSCGS